MKKLNKKMVIGASVIIALLITVVLVMTFVNKGSKGDGVLEDIVEQSSDDEQIETDADIEEVTSDEDSLDHLFDVKAMSITAKDEIDGSIKTDTAFEIKIEGQLGLEAIKQYLKVSVNQPYEIVQKEDESEAEVFELTFSQPLATGKVVSMVFDKVEKPFGFAFQTVKALKVSSVYPGDNAWSVPTNSVIEIRFTKEVDPSVVDYIRFSPSIEGRFEVSDNLCRFIPTNELSPNSEYEVIIEEGYSQGEEMLEVYTSSFETQYTSDYNEGGFTFADNELLYISPDFPMVFTGYNNTYESDEQVPVLAYKLEDISDLLGMKHMNVDELLASFSEEALITLTGVIDDTSYRSKLIVSDSLDLGYYYVMIDDGISYDGQLVQVTHYNTYAIADVDQVLVWVQNDIGLSNICEVDLGNGIKGITDSQGLLNQSMSVPQDSTLQIEIKTEEADPFYMMMETWGYERRLEEDYWLFLATDRQVYLPTDEAFVSGFINHKEGKNPTEVTVRFKRGDVIYSEETVAVSPLGDYVTSYAWEDYYQYGMTVEVLLGEALLQRAYVSISQFEKPTYTVSLATEESLLQMGDTLHIYGDATYFEGTPLQSPTITVGASWGADLGSGYDQSITINGDEQGHYNHGIVPYYDTTSWRPMSKNISVSLGGIDTYYDQTHVYYTLVPRDQMILGQVEEANEGFIALFTMNEIDMENIHTGYYNYEAYKGPEVVGREALVEIRDYYYEEIYQGQKYDPIMKVFYDDYSYKYHNDLVYSASYETNEYGKIAIPYNMTQEGHRYEIKLTTKDSRDGMIVESVTYGESWFVDRSYSGDKYLQLETDKYNCELGEAVTAYISSDGNQYVGSDMDRTLFMTVIDGIEMISVIDETALTFNYPDEMVTGIEVKAVYYDGHTIRQVFSYYNLLYVDHESRSLNLEVEVDKEQYRPGETVEGSVKVTYEDGSPAQGFVDMKVVDEAYYALFEDYYNPLGDILTYHYNNQVIGEAYATSYWDDNFYGAEGGEGGEGAFRSEFKNTAYADHLAIDEQGLAQFSYTLPDNLTKWRMTFGAIDPNVYAGTTTKNIDGTLPFHISLMSAKTYTVGDDIGITLKSGSRELMDTEVAYAIEILKDDVSVYQTEAVGDVQGYVYLPIGQLELGAYVIEISASAGAYHDAIKYELKLVESRQHVPLVVEDVLSEGMSVTHNDQQVSMQFMNELAWQRYLMLRDLLAGNKKRNEYAVASFIARNYMEDSGIDFPAFGDDDYQPFVGRGNNDLYKPLENSDGTVMTTVDILEMGWLSYMDDYDIDKISTALKNHIEYNSGSYSDDAAAVYGLALLGEPVLLELRELLIMDGYKDDETARMYLLKGLTALGDYSTALTYLESFGYDAKGVNQGKTGVVKSDALLMTIYTDLNMTLEAETIYNRITSLKRLEEPIVAQKFYYLTHLPTNILDVSFGLAYGEHREVIQLDYNDMHSISISNEEAESIDFTKIDGKVKVITNYIGDYRDVEQGDGISMTSTIVKSDSIHVGDEIKIVHHIEVSNGMKSFAIHDVIPAGTVMIGDPYFSGDGVSGYTFLNSTGKNATFYGYIYKSDENDMLPETYSFNVTYTVRATSIGAYILEPAVLQDYKNHQLTVGDELLVSIVE